MFWIKNMTWADKKAVVIAIHKDAVHSKLVSQQANIEPDFLMEQMDVTCWYLRPVRGRKWHAFILRFLLMMGEGRTNDVRPVWASYWCSCVAALLWRQWKSVRHPCPAQQKNEATFKNWRPYILCMLASDILCAPSCHLRSYSAGLELKPEVYRHPNQLSRDSTVTLQICPRLFRLHSYVCGLSFATMKPHTIFVCCTTHY